jgi:predicted alpha/beta hydrolase
MGDVILSGGMTCTDLTRMTVHHYHAQAADGSGEDEAPTASLAAVMGCRNSGCSEGIHVAAIKYRGTRQSRPSFSTSNVASSEGPTASAVCPIQR